MVNNNNPNYEDKFEKNEQFHCEKSIRFNKLRKEKKYISKKLIKEHEAVGNR